MTGSGGSGGVPCHGCGRPYDNECADAPIALEVRKAAARSASFRDGVIAAANWLTADGSPMTAGALVAALLADPKSAAEACEHWPAYAVGACPKCGAMAAEKAPRDGAGE